MSVDENKTIVRRYIEIGWSKGDYDVIGESVTPDYRRHQPNLPIPCESGEDLKQVVRMYRAGLPDLEVVIDRMVAEGDQVVTHVTARRTHNGELAGIPPTGRSVEFTAMDIFNMKDGRIVESWHNVDDLGAFTQLGVLPAPDE
jgi:steroid delta-isomerase-like uncharacterized protein